MDKGILYHEAMTEFNIGMKRGLEGYLQCGKAILTIKEQRLWKLDGAHVNSFGHWVKNVLHVSPAQAHRMSQVYRELGPLLMRPELQTDIQKITLLLPHIQGATEERKEELLVMAKDLTIEDLKNNILEQQGKGDLCTDICQHLELIPASKCSKCGKWFLNSHQVEE